MAYQKARGNQRQFKALTSLTIEQFDTLLSIFEIKWASFIEKFNLDGTPRCRKYVPKNETQLPSLADKLFFILYYKKTNSLQEVVALQFDLDVSMVNKWIHVLSPLLEKSLEKFIPTSRIELADFQENETYIIDATERPIQRDTYDQKTFYSGKKKTHTLKNALIVSTVGLIIWLGQTQTGNTSDKRLIDTLSFKKSISMLADLGFLGWNPINVTLTLPHKKPRNSKKVTRELSPEKKDVNTALARRRVKVENVLAHVKVLRIVKDRTRNYRFGFRENLMKTACGLYNFRKLHPEIVLKQEIIC